MSLNFELMKNLLMDGISYASLFLILNMFLEKRKIYFSKNLICGFLTLLLLIGIHMFPSEARNSTMAIFCLFSPLLFAIFFFTNPLSEKLIAYVYLLLLIFVLNIVTYGIFTRGLGYQETDPILSESELVLRLVLIGFYYYIKHFKRFRFDMSLKFLSSKQRFFLFLTLLLAMSYSFFIVYYIAFQNYSIFYFRVKTVFSVLTLSIVLFLTAYLLQKIKKESRLDYEHEKINAILTYQTKYYERIEHALIEARRLKHDMKNHTITIGHLIQSGEDHAALDYLETLGTAIESIEVGFSTGHRIVDVIMYEKKKFCASKGIPFHFMGHVSEDLPYASTDLCIIIGNAIDNAIEACLKVNRELEPFIEVETYSKQGHWIFKVANTALPVDINRLTSTKLNKSQHGYGIRNIRESVQKYGGHVNFLYQEGCFKAQVLMPYFRSDGGKD